MFPPIGPNFVIPQPEIEPAAPAPVPPPPQAMTPPAPQGPAWLQMLPLLFAAGARIGGAPVVGTGALQGFQQGQLLEDRRRAQQVAEGQRQQQLDLQNQRMQLELQQMAEVRRIQEEQRRQAAINASVDNLRAQKFSTKTDYDAAVTAHETMLARAYGVRPNTLRAMVPFNAPNVAETAAKALEPMIKEYGLDAVIGSGGFVDIDRDGDGVPERVPITDAMQLAGIQVLKGPDGKPFRAPKKVDNPQEFDVVYAGMIAKAQAEGKEITEALKGDLALQAIEEISKRRKEGVVAGAPGSADGGLKEYQKFTAGEKLATTWTKANSAIREMNRQYGLMQTGLRRFQQGDKIGGSQAVLVTFQKVLDPTSVVRESEYSRSPQGLALISRLEGFAERLAKGGAGVPQAELAGMVETARQFLEQMQGYTAGQRKRIGRVAQTYGIDPALVFDELAPPDEPHATAAPAPVAADGVPTPVKSLLKGKPDGHYKLTDGSVWIVQDGQIRRGQ